MESPDYWRGHRDGYRQALERLLERGSPLRHLYRLRSGEWKWVIRLEEIEHELRQKYPERRDA